MTSLHFNIESSAFGRLSKELSSANGRLNDRNKRNPVYQLTVGIIPLYKSCNTNFKPVTSRPQRMLTNPSEGVSNNGCDNIDANLICRVGDKLINGSGKAFVVLDMLGTGTFGQVFRCQREDNKEIVAVKIIKNKPAYHSQGMLEVKIALLLNNTYDPNNDKHIVRLLDNFEHKQHICLVFELLSMSLLDVLTQNQFRGLPLSVVQRFSKQILTALVTLQDANIIHCDLKPENILLQPASTAKPRSDSIASSYGEELTMEAKKPSVSDVKVIDFGSACFEGKTVYSYIQSRFYRSPEVLLGVPYNGSIDMWSLACVCAEMYLGLPLFPGVSQHNQLSRIVEMLGVPPDFLVEGKNGSKYFTTTQLNSPSRHANKDDRNILNFVSGKYRIKTSEEYAHENNVEVPVLKKYLKYTHLDEVIMKCPLPNKAKMSIDQRHNEMMKRRSFLDFLQGLFNLNPFDRWTAQQAMSHPFILNMPFNGPFQPPVDLKAKERKLMFAYQTKQAIVRPEDVGLHGLRAPTNFGGGNDQFTLLQYRRLSEPVETKSQANYMMPEQFVNQKPSAEPNRPVAVVTPVDDPMMSETRPSLKRGNPVHINASYVEDSSMERAMHQAQKTSPRGAPPPPPHYHMSQSYQPQGVAAPMYANQQQQYSPRHHQQQQQQQQQQQYQISNNQPFSGNKHYSFPIPPSHAVGYQHQPQQQHLQSQMYPSPTAASFTASSMGVFGHGGSMQEGPQGMIMTDFGLALLRPDMDEQRRLMSHNVAYSPHVSQSYAGGMQQHQQSGPLTHPKYHDNSSPRAQQQQYSTAHSLDYQSGNMARYAMMSSAAPHGGAALSHIQPPLPDAYLGHRTGPELPSPVQQYSRSNSRRLHQHSSSNYAPSTSLSITIPTPLNPEPVQEPVLAYSFQNNDISNSLANSINYTNQWENTHMAVGAASLSRSLGFNTIQQQHLQQHNMRKESDAPTMDDYDELTDDSSPKVSYKSISTRTSESSDAGGRTLSSDKDITDSGNSRVRSNNNNNNGSSNKSKSSVKEASDALDNWDPFVDTEED